ncbi:MAG: ATP-binding cassette domain-containing protein [Rickettsiales bacterium]|nr:MAG: ATP-binding cassette domain-containing protein [Rickettsiales bacterium]
MKAGNNIKELARYLYSHVYALIIVLISLLSVTLSLLLIGYVFRHLIDGGVVQDKIEIIHHSIYIICILIAIFALGSFFRSYYINLITLKVISKIKADTYKNLLKSDIAIFENLKIGDIISRLSTDADLVGNLIVNFLSFFIRNSIMLMGAIIMMFLQSPKLSCLVIMSIPIILLPIIRLSKFVRYLSKKVLEEQSLFVSNVEENFSGIRTLYAYNQQEHTLIQLNNKIDHYISQASVRLKYRSLFFALAITLISGSIITIIWIGSLDIIKGSMSSGEMISFIYYAIMVGMSAGGIAELFSEIQSPLAALDRVFELKEMKSNIQVEQNRKIINFNHNIRFDKVTFAYPARPDNIILNNIELEIKHGIFTAIVGRSGAGKSTLLQLLLKFYNPQQGNILIGNENIDQLNSDSVRSKIAYVEQNPIIFSGSIRSNIIFANPSANDETIEKIVDICGIRQFASQLEHGLDTEIGERGVRLSGGQKQKINIARALIYSPEILLLDEAMSALDSDSESEILKNIETIFKNKTVISIAHRISSIENADEILVIDQGKIIDIGSHEQLLESSKIYNLLYKEQL